MMDKKFDDKLSVEMLQIALLETESDEDVLDDDSDFEEVEAIHSESDHSDSDEEDMFENSWDRINSKVRSDSDCYTSENGKIKWFKNSSVSSVPGITSCDIDCSGLGVQPNASKLSTPHEIFSLFFDDRVLDLIVSHTNSRLKNICKRYDRYRDSRELTKEELSAYIGLLLYSGVMKSSHGQVKDLWAQDGTGIDIFRLTMSFSRFQFITSCLRFDNYEMRRINMKNDRLIVVRDMMNIIQSNFKKAYIPGNSVSVYEHVIPFKGKCHFKQHSSQKPKNYGIKLNCLVDTKTFYFLSCNINTVKRKHLDHTKILNALPLLDEFRGSCRDVLTSPPYTSVQLAIELKQRGLFLVGSVGRKDKDVPKIFRKLKKPVKSSLYGFTDELALISYVPHKRTTTIYLSSRKQDRCVDPNAFVPEPVMLVANLERYMEELNQSLLNFGVGRKTRRWPLLIFFHLLNMATMNSQIIFNQNSKSNTMTKSEFVRQMSLGLIREQMEKRSQSGYLPKELRKRIRLNVDGTEDGQPLVTFPVEGPSKGRCHVCPRMRDKKSSTKCCMCHHFVCKEHALVTCANCYQSVQH